MSALLSAKVLSRSFLVLLLSLISGVLLPAMASAAAAQRAAPTCDDAVPLALDTTWREAGWSEGTACFRLDLMASDLGGADVVIVELLQAPLDERAHLTLLEASSRNQLLLHTATTLVLAATPGAVHLGVVTDDPQALLPPFRLHVTRARVVTRHEDDTELELEPDPLVVPGAYTKDEDDTELELEPDPLVAGAYTKDEDDTELELEPDPLVAAVESTRSDLSVLDRARPLASGPARPVDDHGDTFFHATPLRPGRSIEGQLANDWGDDMDVFRFDVTSVGPVELSIESKAEAIVALSDRHGQRLEVIVAGQGPKIRSLVAGRYFVQVSGVPGRFRFTTTPLRP